MRTKFKMGDNVVIIPNKKMSSNVSGFTRLIGQTCEITYVYQRIGDKPIYILNNNRFFINFTESCLSFATISDWEAELQ